MRKMGRILSVSVAAVLILSLTGCGSVVESLEEKASSAISDYISEKTDDIAEDFWGGSSSDNDDTDSLPIGMDESKELLTKLAEKDGYQVTFNYTSYGVTEKTIYGQTNDSWWSLNEDGGGSGYLLEGDVYHFYECYDGEWSYTSSVTKGSYGDIAATMTAVPMTYLYLGNTYDGLFTKSGTDSVAGRKCDVYKYGYGAEALGYGYSYTICIDQEYGITLKMEMSATAGTDSAGISMEVLDFATGSKVKKPDFPKPDSYSVLDMSSGKWPDNEFTAIVPSIPSGATVYMTSSEGDTFNGMLQNVTADGAREFIKAVIAKGFGDSDSMQEYEGMLYFEGSNSKDQSVGVTFTGDSMIIAITK